jgi:tetratricopeptide (TPR) repeat protein
LRSAIFCGRGVAWAAKREYEKAIEDYSSAIELDPRNVVARQDRAYVWSAKKQYDKAIADLDLAIRLRPDDAVLYFDRGRAWHQTGDFDKAIDDFSEAVSLRPYFANAFASRGAAWSAKKSYDQATADFNTAVRLEPGSPVGYNARAWFWATCPDAGHRNGVAALESARKSCDLTHWKDATGLDTLASACAETGDFAAAVKWQSQAIDLVADQSKTDEYRARLKLYQEKKVYRQ